VVYRAEGLDIYLEICLEVISVNRILIERCVADISEYFETKFSEIEKAYLLFTGCS
jgi:hypothetical protein